MLEIQLGAGSIAVSCAVEYAEYVEHVVRDGRRHADFGDINVLDVTVTSTQYRRPRWTLVHSSIKSNTSNTRVLPTSISSAVYLA